MKTRFICWILDHPRSVLAAVGALSLGFALALSGLQLNATPYLMGRDHPSRLAEREIDELFDNTGEQVLVVLRTRGASLFEPQALQTLRALTEELRALSLVDAADEALLRAMALDPESQRQVAQILEGGVNRADTAALQQLSELLAARSPQAAGQLAQLRLRAAPIRRVRSLASVENLVVDGESLVVRPLVPRGEPQADALPRLAAEARDNPLWKGLLLSQNERASAIQLELAIPEFDQRNTTRVHDAIAALIARIAPDEDVFVAGAPVVLAEVARSMEQDNTRFFPLVLLVTAVLLYASFRRWRGVLIPLLIMGLTVLWTLGLMAVCGVPLNLITTSLPVFLVTIGVEDCIHFLSAYGAREPGQRRAALLATFEDKFWPMFLTSATTATGLLVLAPTELPFIREFSVFTAAGAGIAWLLTVLLLPVLLMLLPQLAASSGAASPALARLGALGGGAAAWLVRRRVAAACALAPLLLVALWSALQIAPGFSSLLAFDEQVPLRRAHTEIHRELGGSVPVDLWVSAPAGQSFTDPAALRALDELGQRLRRQPEFGYVISAGDFLARIHQLLTPGAPFELPERMTREQIAQYLLLYESGRGRELFELLDPSYRHARIIALARTDEGVVWKRALDEIETAAAELLPPGYELHTSGYGQIMRTVLGEVVRGQIVSLLLAVLFTAVPLVIGLRSLALGFAAMLPTALTVLGVFAAMSALGVELNLATSIIAAVAVGIGSGYAIHYLSSLRRLVDEGEPLERALAAAAAEVSGPILANSLALSLGFLVLCMSGYALLRQLGLLISGTFVLCAFVSLAVLPLALALLRPRALRAELQAAAASESCSTEPSQAAAPHSAAAAGH